MNVEVSCPRCGKPARVDLAAESPPSSPAVYAVTGVAASCACFPEAQARSEAVEAAAAVDRAAEAALGCLRSAVVAGAGGAGLLFPSGGFRRYRRPPERRRFPVPK